MECNCNNNNSNGGVIPWVRGNRLPLIICVYENVVTQEQVGDSTLTVNEMTRVPYAIQADDTVTVIMKSGFRQVEMPFTTDGNKVMVTDNGELPTGAYTVEVIIEQGNGARGRWQETRQVRIYENTSDAQLGEMYSIDADLFFYAKGDTGTGIADITNNPDGTLTITMTDGTSYVTDALKGDKGDKGDTGERGVSIVSFDVTGQTDVSVIYTVTFSDDTTQDISVPKGPQGDTGLTGNGISTTTLNSDYTLTIAYTDGTTYTTPSIRGAQGAQGVSVIGFTQTGETATNTMYNLVFSDGRTQSVAIPKGVKGDKGDTGNTGPQGAQGPKGDTVTATDYTLYNVQGSDSQGAMSQDATTKAISAQTGYYTCGTAAGTPEKVVTVESGNLYKRTLGGHFKVKMTNKNTAASGVTLQIGSETATTLWYNGAAVSADNSWDAGEVISVYYDGSVYQASNAQGGGGKAEKIKYNNSQSGLVAENVQGALDEIDRNVNEYTTIPKNIPLTNSNLGYYIGGGPGAWVWRRAITQINNTAYAVNEGETYRLTANSNKFNRYFFIKSLPTGTGNIDFSSDVNGHDIAAGESSIFTVPADCNFITFYALDSMPASFEHLIPVNDIVPETEKASISDGTDTAITLEKTSSSYWGYSNQQPTIGTADNFVRAEYIDVTPYKMMKLQFYRQSNFGAVSFFADDNGKMIGEPLVNTSRGYLNYIVPKGATRLYLTHYTGTGQSDFNAIGSTKITALLLAESASEYSDEVDKLDTYTIGSPIEVTLINGSIINANTGGESTQTDYARTDYIETCGAKYIRFTRALIGSQYMGLAFYSDARYDSYINGLKFTKYSTTVSYDVIDIPVPDGACFLRFTAFSSSNAKHFTPWYSLIYGAADLFKDAAASQIATQIMRSCKSISQGVLPNNLTTNYAFSSTMQIVGSYAYVNYAAGNTLDEDSPTPSDITVGCLAKISLETNEVVETLHPSVANYYDDEGNAVQGYKSFVSILMKNKNGQLGYFCQMVIPGSNKPIIAVSEFGTFESLEENSRRMCKLQYTANGVEHNVRFSIENYRQMLVDMGYVSTYHAPLYDGFDNNCIIYDSASDKYYDLICTVSSGGYSLPLILLESDDLHTWTLHSRVGTELWTANEIEGVIKNGKLYAALRTIPAVNSAKWVVYDIENMSIVSQGGFNIGSAVSRPYTFIFNNNVYMVINVNPTVYGLMVNVTNARDNDIRSEVNIYKIVNDVPVFMRKVNNPTGLNYHCWEEVPQYTNAGQSAPVTGYGAVYCAFSEDRRLLYRRMFSQVSFGDVTALFADNGRIV